MDVAWKLDSSCLERAVVFSKNLDNCIGESGKKASHGCLLAALSFCDHPWVMVETKRVSKNNS